MKFINRLKKVVIGEKDVVGYGRITNGKKVIELQERLNDHGYPVAPDGIFGPKTHAAVIKFQKSRNLNPDGLVGRKTWRALYGP